MIGIFRHACHVDKLSVRGIGYRRRHGLPKILRTDRIPDLFLFVVFLVRAQRVKAQRNRGIQCRIEIAAVVAVEVQIVSVAAVGHRRVMRREQFGGSVTTAEYLCAEQYQSNKNGSMFHE